MSYRFPVSTSFVKDQNGYGTKLELNYLDVWKMPISSLKKKYSLPNLLKNRPKQNQSQV